MPDMASDGFVPKPCPVIVNGVVAPAYHVAGLSEVITGVASPTLTLYAVLVPAYVVTEMEYTPGVAAAETV